MTLWLDERYRYRMLFTGDPLPDVDRRSLGIEPMTCAPNAFQTGDGLVTLEVGESIAAAWGNRVLVTSRSAASSELGAAGRRTAALEADVTDRAAVEAHVAQIVKRLDRCGALVNDAAIEEPQPLLETCHARA